MGLHSKHHRMGIVNGKATEISETSVIQREGCAMGYRALLDESGSSLVELLVVAAIVGILANIAVPQFSEYRQRAAEAALKIHLRNTAIAEEAYFAFAQSYKSGVLSGATLPGYNGGSDIVGTHAQVNRESFILEAKHVHCPNATWSYDSATSTFAGPPCF